MFTFKMIEYASSDVHAKHTLDFIHLKKKLQYKKIGQAPLLINSISLKS